MSAFPMPQAEPKNVNYWQLLPISAVVIVFAVLLYLVTRWRKARRVFRVMGVVAIANLAAGLLLGLWSMRMLDTRMRTRVENSEGAPGSSASVSPPSPASRALVSGVTPGASDAKLEIASGRISTVLGSYVGQALAQRYAFNAAGGTMETWPQADQGCRLGNYEPTSVLCRAATLAVHGLGSTQAIPFYEVAEFCNAGYLEETLALCLTARHGVGHAADSTDTERVPSGIVNSVPGSDVTKRLRSRVLVARGPNGSWSTWMTVPALCAQGIYAPASPVCEAATIKKHGAHGHERVSYSEVASFCDVKILNDGWEICRAAYRFVRSDSDPVR